ncbi:MAG: penicillin-binding protein 2 [bacterium]
MSVSDILTPARQRAQIIALLVVLAMGILIHRLFIVQLYEGEKYTSSLRNQTTVSVLLLPARGSILDRNGVPLAENKASFDIDIYLRELVGHYARAHHGRLPRVNVPVGTGERQRTRSFVDTAKIVRESTKELFKTLGIKPTFTDIEIYRHYDQRPNVPFPIARNLDFSTLSRFAEKDLHIPGIQETARPVRQYPFGALAPHILGYLGQLEEVTDEDYLPEFVGKKGIERTFDSNLQGTPGGKILRKNNVGMILGEEATVQPKQGRFVYLTIDAQIQWIVENVMRKVGRGAAIVLDPQNGDILAMVSVPSFDPNDFIPKVSKNTWKELTTDATKPLFNRSINSYAPGSTYKPLIAMAALENKNIHFTPQTTINSPAAVWLVNRWWHDWYAGGRGSISLKEGMAMSCNTFFYQLGARTGIQSIMDMGRRFGLGELMLNSNEKEILEGEDAGVLPGPEWMKNIMDQRLKNWREQKKLTGNAKLPRPPIERWSDGHTINTAIGQGYVAVTPLQMAVMMASIANGGHVYYPRLVRGIGEIKNDSLQAAKDFPTRLKGDLGISPENMKAVQESLAAVVEQGTGQRAKVQGWRVAGKTGTAQFVTTIRGNRVKDLRAWFNGYAPFESPRYVVTVLVEGGTGGGATAGPLVNEILQHLIEMEKGAGVEMTRLKPAEGHFYGVQETSANAFSASPVGAPGEQEAAPESEDPFAGGSIQGARGLKLKGR